MTQIREYRPADVQAVVDLSLRAWTPVFASLERILGWELFTRLHGEWRGFQETAVRRELADGAVHAWVAEAGPGVIGFVTAALRDPQRGLGEIGMLAVDPGAQDRGVGTALTEFATDWLRRRGCGSRWWGPEGTRAMRPPGACTRRPVTRCSPWPGTSGPCEPYREIDWGSGAAGDASLARSVASSRNTAARPKVSPTVRPAR